jgi:hypothetical protein
VRLLEREVVWNCDQHIGGDLAATGTELNLLARSDLRAPRDDLSDLCNQLWVLTCHVAAVDHVRLQRLQM